MSNTHQKRDDKFTLCGLRVINVAIVELPEEVTCEYCRSAPLPPPADEQAAADELEAERRSNIANIVTDSHSSPLAKLEAIDRLFAAYSRTQTEAVLQALRKQTETYNDSGNAFVAVPIEAVDAEIARLRGEAGTQIIPTPSTSLSGTTEHLTEQNTKHSIRICREGKEIWKMPDTTTDGEMK